MIKTCHGNIWDSQCKYIVVPVNTVGVLGAGLALDAATRFPTQCSMYINACVSKVFDTGRLMFVSPLLFFPTKRHWKNPSQFEWIEDGLAEFIRLTSPFKANLLPSIAFPALGCGLGGLDWAEVDPLIRALLKDYPAEIEVYPPKGR